MNRSGWLKVTAACLFVLGILASIVMAADKAKAPAPATTPMSVNPAAPRVIAQKKPVVVEVKDMLMVIGAKEAKVVATVKSLDGVPVAKGEIKFKINGDPTDVLMVGYPFKSLKLETFSGGPVYWSIPAYLNGPYKNLHMGSNTIEAEFAGNNEYAAGKGKGNLAIMKAATKMDIGVFCTTPCISGAPENRRKMMGSIARITDGEGLDGRAVVITLDGKKIGTVPTSKGTFQIEHDFTDAERGRAMKLKAAFEGDDLHLATAAERDMTVPAIHQ